MRSPVCFLPAWAICSPSGFYRRRARLSPGWSSSSLPRRPRARPISRGGRLFRFRVAPLPPRSAYLTVSETFPLEVRALAIAFFYAVGTGIGGVAGPWLFGALIDTGSRWSVFGAYRVGPVLMLAAALVGALFAVAAERKSLESISRPLAAAD